jgi:hypothetical protein
VYFDRNGVATIADVPDVGASADWLVDASASGVLIELDRERSRTDTRNVVVVESSAADGAKFPTQYVWDDDPTSPDVRGPARDGQPGRRPARSGCPYFYDTPIHDVGVGADAGSRSCRGRRGWRRRCRSVRCRTRRWTPSTCST